MFDSHTDSNFATRHIGVDSAALATMMDVIGAESLEELAAKALPAGILDARNNQGVAQGLDNPPATIN